MKEFIGVVVSAKLPLTATVLIERRTAHPVYKKTLVKSLKVKSHNPKGAKVGDKVKIGEVRPISKDKHFNIIEVWEKNGKISKQIKKRR